MWKMCLLVQYNKAETFINPGLKITWGLVLIRDYSLICYQVWVPQEQTHFWFLFSSVLSSVLLSSLP